MATVLNRGNNELGVDYSYSAPNRILAGDPNALATAPLFSGEIIRDSVGKKLWQAQGLKTETNKWVPVDPNLYGGNFNTES